MRQKTKRPVSEGTGRLLFTVLQMDLAFWQGLTYNLMRIKSLRLPGNRVRLHCNDD